MISFKNKAFTIIELLVWISILLIILMWVSNLDYNRLNQIQKLEIFINKVKSNFETIRNNSLIWKWIWNWLNIPSKWTINYSVSNSWTITAIAYSGSNILNSESINFEPWISIDRIRCLKYNWTSNKTLNNSETWSIDIIWNKITLSWDCSSIDSKILEITVWNKINTWSILINTLNWLVETN